MKFYKILNEKECHNGLQYKTGLNVDPLAFNPKGTCEPGGIYYTQKDILAFLRYGPWIREVVIPDDAQVYKDPDENPEKWKANKVVLRKRRRITPEVVEELIKEGADACADGNEALHWASTNGRIEIIKALLENGANVHAEDDRPLRYAAAYGHTGTVKLLLENGADVHAWDDYALRWASYNGNTETVKVLLENGADVHARNGEALKGASINGHTKIVKLLKEWMEKENTK